MENKFEEGDLVILKSDEFSKNPVIMTVAKITADPTRVSCSYSENGKIITKFIYTVSLTRYQPKND